MNAFIDSYGAIGDGSPINASVNTSAFKQAIAAIEASGTPGTVVVGDGTYAVTNGEIVSNVPNIRISGSRSQGDGIPNIVAIGAGDTITVNGVGSVVEGLSFTSDGPQTAAYIRVNGNQSTVRDIHMRNPFIGIYLYLAPNPSNPDGHYADGEFWVDDIHIEGRTIQAGIVVNISQAACRLRHVIMNSWDAPQPPYGILAMSYGELVMTDACDIINMGNCLAIIPGDGQKAIATFISDCLFDGGNGLGCLLIAPSGNGFVSTVKLANVWASTAVNKQNTNGFTFLGNSRPAAYPSIQDVSLVNCISKGFAGHAGLYARNVQGLSIIGSTFSGNYNGIHLSSGMSDFILQGNKCGNFSPQGPNTAHGIALEAGPSDHFAVIGNLCRGNGFSPMAIGVAPSINKVIFGNVA